MAYASAAGPLWPGTRGMDYAGLWIVDGSWWYGHCGLEMENGAPTAVVPGKGPRIEATEGSPVRVLGLSKAPELRRAPGGANDGFGLVKGPRIESTRGGANEG